MQRVAKTEIGKHRNPKIVLCLLPSAFCLLMALALPHITSAAVPSIITFRHDHHLFTIATKDYPQWQSKKEQLMYQGMPWDAPASFRVDGDVLPALPAGVTKSSSPAWNHSAIRTDLEAILKPLERDPGSVIIARSSTGVIFHGVGLPGRHVDLDLTVALAIQALEQGISDIRLPVTEIQPSIIVNDPALAQQGIKEVVTVGESDFSNSPANRRHNIATGLNKFDGHLIPQGSIFSFGETLGPVNARTGYLKELVIKGARTEPDYGGGLCQVSSTAYRGVWEYGLPITQRKNHSFAVNHYAPQGTDATVYPPTVDMKFKNDGPSALLMQTYSEGDLAYFIYYGTKDMRDTEVIGPFIWNRSSPPGDRYERTTEIPPGTTKKVGSRVPGMSAMWVRITKMPDGKEKVEPVYSVYEARPLYILVGVDPSELPPGGFGGSTEEVPADLLGEAVEDLSAAGD